MELYQLKTFAVVADAGNLSRAAGILHTSQPAVSAQIKALETEFGMDLFTRTGRGVVLTENGKKIKDKIEMILTNVRDLAYLLPELKNEVRLAMKIALNTDAGVLKLKELLERASREQPQLEFHFTQSTTAEILRNLRKAQIDGGFIFGTRPGEDVEPLFLKTVDLVIALPLAWKAKTAHASIKEILELPWVLPPADCPLYLKTSDLLQKYAVKPRQFVCSDHETTTRQLIQSGIGISLLPEYMCRVPAVKNELWVWEKVGLQIELSFVYLKKNKDMPGIKILLGLLKKVWNL